MKPANPVKLVTSCRTDTGLIKDFHLSFKQKFFLGVNALHNTGHFDILQQDDKGLPNPKGITKNLNSWLLARKSAFQFNIQIVKF